MVDRSLLGSSRRLRALWGVEAADTVATGLADIALPWFVLTVTGSPLGLGVAFALRSAPDVVASPLVGGLIDRRPRSRLLAATPAPPC